MRFKDWIAALRQASAGLVIPTEKGAVSRMLPGAMAAMLLSFASAHSQPAPGTALDVEMLVPRQKQFVPTPSGSRNWAFFANEGTVPANWSAVNSGWSKQPIDGLSTFTNSGDGFFAGTGLQWSPTAHAQMLNIQYGTPGSGGWPGKIDMGQAAQGAYDATWLSWLNADADAAKAEGAPITVVRIWQEINGNWFGWSVNQTGATSVDGTPGGSPWPVATIMVAWQHMAEQVRTALPNAKIEWNLASGTGWAGMPGNGSGYDLYPGDNYVDVIGIDSYEHATSWKRLVDGAGVNLTNLVAFAAAHNKLVGVSETAATNGDGNYLTNWAKWLDSLGPRAAYLSYFDQGVNPQEDTLWGSNGGALKNALNASSFGTKPYGSRP